MAAAGSVAGNLQIKSLIGAAARDASGDDVRAGTVPFQGYMVGAQSLLHAVGHQSLTNDQVRVRGKLRCSGTVRGINALDLDHLHLHAASFFHIDFGLRIQDSLPESVPGAIMFLHIFDMGILSDPETVDPVMFGILCSAVVDAAAGDNQNVAVFPHMEIVIDCLRQAAGADDDRDMDALLFCSVFDRNIQSGAVRL